MISGKYIEFACGQKYYHIPNAWELLSMRQYMNLCANITRMAKGELPAAMVRVLYVCDVMGWQPEKIKDGEALCNLTMLGDRITFIFNIEYPEGSLDSISAEERAVFCKTPPERGTSAMARYLSKLDYNYVVDSCFCAQLVPFVNFGEKEIDGYMVDTGFGTLTCSLRALQYLEATELAGCKNDQLPLLAAILYQPSGEPYSSAKAHKSAEEFAKLPENTLQAIAFNFISLNNFLFKKTHFYLLTAGQAKPESPISVGAMDSLYNLSADGYGDVNAVEQMNIIQYLTINRKKLIDSVKSMKDADMKLPDIAGKTGLSLSIINDILK